MKHTISQVFHSGKFVTGFVIFMTILLIVSGYHIYSLFVHVDPLAIIAKGTEKGTFFPPGVYVSTYDVVNAQNHYKLDLTDAAAKRIAGRLGDQEREDMKTWLMGAGISEDKIDVNDTKGLMELWLNNFDGKKTIPGMTNAKRNYYVRLNTSVKNILSTEGITLAQTEPTTGALQPLGSINQSDYVNLTEVTNVRVLPLGTDNFGRDVWTELVKAIEISLLIGLFAGFVATFIGLVLGLFSGYIGGRLDDIIMFITNIFTVIPSLVLAILISFSVGQERRGPVTVALVIGFTSWVWTTRAVRAQVISLRNRDHVNLSKLSGHSIVHIIVADILPYIASYVVMALILQISSGILTEASLSILGLGPRTTSVPTLGLMMQWAMTYLAMSNGYWWAYLPVIIAIALVAFSLNLMNTGLDQVFNPALRD
jgi:peptide/nickel transport system permease protein